MTTRPDQAEYVAARYDAGFALPSAIFLLVVLAGLAGFLVAVSSSQQQGQVQDVEGVRAYWAAKAATDYAITLALAPADTSGATSFAACPAGVPGGAIDGFAVTVACSRSPAVGFLTENGFNLVAYTLQVVARKGTPGGIGTVERSLSTTVVKCKNPNALLPGGAADPRSRC